MMKRIINRYRLLCIQNYFGECITLFNFFRISSSTMPGVLNPKKQTHPKSEEARNQKYREGLVEIDFLEDICRRVRKDSPEKSSFLVYHLLQMHRSGKIDENTRLRIWNHLMFDRAPDQAMLIKFRSCLYEEIVEELGYPFNLTQ